MKIALCWPKQVAVLNRSSVRMVGARAHPRATQWRKVVAHGASRGLRVSVGSNPGGATANAVGGETGFLPPLRRFSRSIRLTHGLRLGLWSFATPRLGPALAAFLLFSLFSPANCAILKTQNVFLIISDGFRWQEVFNGAEADLMTEKNGAVKDTNALRSQFWRDT